MTTLSLQLNPTIPSTYLRIADGLRHAIREGKLYPGESLPSSRYLAGQLKTNRHTVMAAYQELIAQGWLESEQRKGYRVASQLPVETSQSRQSSASSSTAAFDWPLNPGVTPIEPQITAHSFTYNFAGGAPDTRLFPFDEFKSCVRASLSRPNPDDLNYSAYAGSPLFIQQATDYLRRMRAITDKELIVVNGSQEALYLTARLLLQPGDKVAVESLGYRPAWDTFRTAGAELLAVRQHDQGIDIEHLTTLLETQAIKLLYLTPLHQYPTTVTLPIHERLAIYRLAVKHKVVIIEDDYDHEFHYDSQPLAPMAADDPYGQIVYLSTFSKLLFPGCRLGVMAVPPSLAPYLLNYRKLINHKPNFLMQDALGRWMREQGFERHLRRTTKRYQQRRDHLAAELNALKSKGIELDFTQPAGGMALWVDVKRDAEQLAQYGREHGIYLVAEPFFHLHANNNQNRYIRLGYASMTREQLTEGLAELASFWR